MNNEYKLEMILNPHVHDNPEAPYFWCVYAYSGTGWYNAASGWAKSVEEGAKAGLEAYNRLTGKEVND